MSPAAKISQIPLDLGHRAALGRADFLVAEENADAVSWVDAWPQWPAPAFILHGPAASGKTHLLHVWREVSGAQAVPAGALTVDGVPDLLAANRALAIDDADRIAGNRPAEEALFHLYNLMKSDGGTMMLCAQTPPNDWGFAVADLASRLRAAPAAGLRPPGDALLSAVLAKLFADRQISVTPGMIAYLLPRMERSFEGARSLVARLDEAALAQKRPVTIPLARAVLDGQGDLPGV